VQRRLERSEAMAAACWRTSLIDAPSGALALDVSKAVVADVDPHDLTHLKEP